MASTKNVMKKSKINTTVRFLFFAGLIHSSRAAFACSTCGCSLNSDWECQGLATGPGLRWDFRYDYLDQNQIRSGRSKVDVWPVSGHEQELYTRNQYYTIGLDYAADENWGLNLQLPTIVRTHATQGLNFDGTDDGTSSARGLGDIRIVARYQGVLPDHALGLQMGFKLPTGGYQQTFNGGAMAGEILDRGLQLGTGTTDLLLGFFRFGQVNRDIDYFATAMAQLPLDSRADYRPGQSVNLNLGVRYLGFGKCMPLLQINGRASAKDTGQNATPDDSGGRVLYLSPGLAFPVGERLKAYVFWQLPVYQDLNGYQLAPKSIFTLGGRMEF
jgi:hypothetical protein